MLTSWVGNFGASTEQNATPILSISFIAGLLHQEESLNSITALLPSFALLSKFLILIEILNIVPKADGI